MVVTPHPRSRRSLRLLLWVSLLAIGAVLYSRLWRGAALGPEFAYIPTENALLVATGEIGALWRAAEWHVRGYLEFDDSLVCEGLDALAQEAAKIGIEVASPDDLEAYGLDLGRGVLASRFRTQLGGNDSLIAVLPVDDFTQLVDGIAAALDVAPRQSVLQPGTGTGRTYDVFALGQWLLVHPEDGIAVVSDSETLLRRSLFQQSLNFRTALNDDALNGAIRRVLRRPLMSGPVVFAFRQSRSAPFGEIAAALEVGRGGIELRADTEISSAALRILGDALRPAPDDIAWREMLPARTLTTLTVRDRQLPRYLDLLLKNGDLEDGPMTEILQGLSGSGGVRAVSVAVTGMRDGLPEIALGVWGDRETLEDLRWQVQRVMRLARDRTLLESALRRAEESGRSPAAAIDELLAQEPTAAFARYPLSERHEGRLEVGRAELHRTDLPPESYRREFHGHSIEFLAPALTVNDVEFRPELEELDREMLLDDSFRAASVLFEESLWLANDIQVLKSLILQRLGERQSLLDDPLYRSLMPRDDSKLELYLDVDDLRTAVLFGGEDLEKIGEFFDQNLSRHPALDLSVAPSDWGRRLALKLEIASRDD